MWRGGRTNGFKMTPPRMRIRVASALEHARHQLSRARSRNRRLGYGSRPDQAAGKISDFQYSYRIADHELVFACNATLRPRRTLAPARVARSSVLVGQDAGSGLVCKLLKAWTPASLSPSN